MCDSRGAMTPVSVGVGTPSFMNEAPSPLGQLDPHRFVIFQLFYLKAIISVKFY